MVQYEVVLRERKTEMKTNIFLIGFMGSGKSTISRTLKEKYGMRLVEMDEAIEEQEKKKISEIFAESGEPYFRALETKLLERLAQQGNTVVSCGGGVPMRAQNVEIMRRSGRVVYLSAEPETVYERIHSQHHRPLLEGNMNVSYIAALLEERLPRYQAAADLTVRTDGRSADEICEEILSAQPSEDE